MLKVMLCFIFPYLYNNPLHCYCTQCFVMSKVKCSQYDSWTRKYKGRDEKWKKGKFYLAEMIRRGMESCYLPLWQPNEDSFSRLCSRWKLSASSLVKTLSRKLSQSKRNEPNHSFFLSFPCFLWRAFAVGMNYEFSDRKSIFYFWFYK